MYTYVHLYIYICIYTLTPISYIQQSLIGEDDAEPQIDSVYVCVCVCMRMCVCVWIWSTPRRGSKRFQKEQRCFWRCITTQITCWRRWRAAVDSVCLCLHERSCVCVCVHVSVCVWIWAAINVDQRGACVVELNFEILYQGIFWRLWRDS